MDLLKSPNQMLLEEIGTVPPEGKDLLMTPLQSVVRETGIIPKFANGKKVLSPEDMKAELLFLKSKKPKFANGGQATDPFSHPELVKAFNAYFK